VLASRSFIPSQPAASGRAVAFAALGLLALAGCGHYTPGTLPATQAVTTDAAWDGEAAISPDGKTIAFVSERADGRRGLFTRPVRGDAEPNALVTGPGDVSRPSWSRDGHRLLYTRIDPATGENRALVIAISAASGSEPRPLGLKGADVRDAVLSPDGEAVAYVARADSGWTLNEARVADLTTRPLFDCGPGEPPTHPTWGRKGAALVFALRGDLWWIAREGGSPARLTFTAAATEREPAISPDGRWVAFVSDSSGVDNVWLARLTGGDGKTAPALGPWRPASASFQPLAHPAWSPDGHTLWFERQDPWTIAAIDAGGGRADTLSSSLFDSREPSYLADDTRVAFSSTRVGPSRIWIMAAAGEARSGPAKQLSRGPGEDVEPDGSKATGQIVYVNRAPALKVATLALTDAAGEDLGGLTPLELAGIDQATRDSAPAWSRDGRSVAFASNRAGVSAIWVIEGVGRKLRLVTVADGTPETPAWSPDGAYLFYGAPGAGGVQLWRVPSAGGASAPWTSDDTPGFADTQPAPSPDGAHIVFTRQRHGDRDLWLMDAAGGAPRPLVTNPRGQDAHANWSSDSRRIVFESGGAVNLYRADVRPLLLR
jgi:Tol biopolymer transport system component